MSLPKSLYLLNPILDDPIYEGFALVSQSSVLGREDIEEDIIPGYEVTEIIREWNPVFLKDKWKTPKVEGRVTTFNDFPCLDGSLPAFSKKACDILNKFLKPNGELLPLNSAVGDYYFFNITKIVDALDIENSVCDFWCDPPTTATDIDYFSFKENKISDLSIFRIIEMPLYTIVTDAFVNKVHESGLKGFWFSKIWPLKPEESWQTLDKENSKKSSQDKFRNSLVIILILSGAKPNTSEAKRIEQIEDDLDSKLILSSCEDTYYGSYEGSDNVNGEFRLFLSCPDVDILTAQLLPWLKQLKWTNPVHAMKRYGGMYDADAKETLLENI